MIPKAIWLLHFHFVSGILFALAAGLLLVGIIGMLILASKRSSRY